MAKLSGILLYLTATESMVPAIKKGDVIIVVPAPEIKPQSIISFRKGEKIITHRVSEIVYINQKEYLKTKGDNNKSGDPDPVSISEVIGRVLLVIPTSLILKAEYFPILFWGLGCLFGLLVTKIF